MVVTAEVRLMVVVLVVVQCIKGLCLALSIMLYHNFPQGVGWEWVTRTHMILGLDLSRQEGRECSFPRLDFHGPPNHWGVIQL